MNETLKSTIIFTLGAATGSVITYFLTKEKFKTKKEEIESVKKTYSEAAENWRTKAHSKDEQIINLSTQCNELEEAWKEAYDMNKTYRKILKDAGYAIKVGTEEDKDLQNKGWKAYEVGEKRDHNEPKIKDAKVVQGLRSNSSPVDEAAGNSVTKFIRKATEEEEEQWAASKDDTKILSEMMEMSEALANRPIGNEPYMISVNEFNEEKPEYEKLTVNYYSGDFTLVDDHEELMDIDSTIGHSVLDYLNEYNSCLYVRNDNLAIDYEVLWLEAGFAEVNGYEA